MKKKGFTLIELLAVIVILAIIALIAMPLVLNTIEKAKEGAAKASAYAYAEEVERYIILSELDPTLPKLQTGVEYQLSSKKYEAAAIADPTTTYINDLVSIKGDKPTEGYLKLNSEYQIEKMEMIIKTYPVTCENDECKIAGSKVEEEEEPEISYPSILEKAKTLVYDENGTCKSDDTTYNYMGGCYIKGTSNNNYIWYNGFMWRIMGINSDNTVRLITDEDVTALAYGAANTALTYTTNQNYIHNWLNEYFYNNLNSTKLIIQNGAYFCSESTNGVAITEGRQTCTSGNEVTTKIGLISVDEYLLANAASSYLNIGQLHWTMTPHNTTNAWRIYYNGNAYDYEVANTSGVRPIINVSSDASVTSGNGSAQLFYVLEENKVNNVTGKLSEVATSGEYVNLAEHKYRVVTKDSNGVKLILDEFYKTSDGTIYTTTYGNSITFSTTSGIGQKLNGDVLNWLGLANSDKIKPATYYQGDGISKDSNYIANLKKSNGVQAKVGLIQVGDILSCQSSTMLTNGYEIASDYSNVTNYWTINKSSTTNNAWIIHSYGTAYSNAYNATNTLRPVITVRNDLDITSGTGTWKNPYQI